MLHKIAIGGFRNKVYRSRAGLWAMGMVLPKHNNVLAILEGPEGKFLIPAGNIVTNAGDLYYAQLGASEATTNAFGILELNSAGTPGKAADRSGFTAIGSTQKVHDVGGGGYPQTDDGDADNTGAGTDIVSYLTSYTKADFNASGISHGLITNTGPAAGEPILTGYAFAAPFTKTADDTLKVFTNHEMLGV